MCAYIGLRSVVINPLRPTLKDSSSSIFYLTLHSQWYEGKLRNMVVVTVGGVCMNLEVGMCAYMGVHGFNK